MIGMYAVQAYTQPGTTIQLDKPQKYEKRTLGAEKTGLKKFTYPKHVYQNTVTHYNYYFNATNRLNDIIERARGSFKDDYTKLLPFYNYSLDVTAADGDIDSVLYKCTCGILLHDLRNDWIDDMYMLMGKAYFFRKNFDSASYVFSYINYAFAPKDDGYDIPIGSNASNTNGIFSVSTKEDNTLWKRITTKPPERNEALLWQAKNLIQLNMDNEAKALLEILRIDPDFPERLQPDLHETIAYWFYKQQVYDSAAFHLSKALDAAENKPEKARWEFLTAQMYQLADSSNKAISYYNKAAEHTIDPIMEVYANLNSIGAYSGNVENVLQQKMDNLIKMAHREKYMDNRDIIYYAAAKVALDMKNKTLAEQLLHKSVQSVSTTNPNPNTVQKSKSFLLLGDIHYDSREYAAAENAYDSVEVSSLKDENDRARISERLPALKIIVDDYAAIHVEDSLQTIAAMPAASRDALVKKILRQLRRAQGLKDADSGATANPAVNITNAPDLFNTSSTGAKITDWYFNNQPLKSSGFTQFRSKWGARPNVDDWRRQSEITKQTALSSNKSNNISDGSTPPPNGTAVTAIGMNDGGAAVPQDLTFEGLLGMLPLTPDKLKASNEKIEKAFFTNGETFQNSLEDYLSAVNSYDSLNHKFPDNSYLEQSLFNLYYCYNKLGLKFSADSSSSALNTKFSAGKWAAVLNNPSSSTAKTEDPATKKYQDIYNLFIEGKFEEAKAAKAAADSLYGNSYWTPQLLFIEAIYYVSKREDSVAVNRLTNLSNLYPQTPLAERAKTMIDVLGRRKEIEDYLTQLQITRYKDDEMPVVNLTPVEPTIYKPNVKPDSTVSKPASQLAVNRVDTSKAAPVILKQFVFNASDPQYVSILLDKVDPVYANEARNAFSRYNKTSYYTQQMAVTSQKLDDRYNIVLIGPFPGASEALSYVEKTRPITGSRIIPWLASDKYTYSMISQSNLALLQETKDLEGYKKLLDKVLPGKF